MRLRRFVVPIVACAVGALAVVALRSLDHASRRRAEGRPNVLLVTLDTVRADHVSAFGYARPTTPTLVALAAQGFRFERAYSPMPVTGPAHASLMTGRQPRDHGVVRNGLRLADPAVTLAEQLRAAGYETAAIVSGYPLAAHFGLAQGFSSYDDAFESATATVPQGEWEGRPLNGAYDRRGDATADRAVALLDRLATGTRPFFAFVHFFDPHSPYAPPGRFASAFGEGRGNLVDLYDGEIAFVDEQLGRLLEALRRHRALEDTLIVVTSDHGEGLGDHGVAEHGSVVYEEAVRVPLLFAWASHLARGASSTAASLADIAPTVLELVGLDDGRGPMGAAGASLASVILGTGKLGPRRVVLEAEHGGRPQSAVTDGRFKLMEGALSWPHRSVFDLLADPRELQGVRAAESPMAAQFEPDLPGPPKGAPENPDLEPRDVEALRALGYLN